MEEAGVPILPGSEGVLKSRGRSARRSPPRSAIPVMLKASAGGGGRGMRIVREAAEFESNYGQAQQEAGAAFSCGDVYMEKLVENPATSSSRSWPTSTATSKSWASANAPSSGGIRS